MKPHLQTTVWTLLEAGASQRQIERVTGIDRKTIRGYQKQFATAAPANSPGVATDSTGVSAGSAQQIPPPRPPASAPVVATASASTCEPHRTFIEVQLRLRRNAMAIYQDLVDHHGFTGAYNAVKRFAGKLRHREPEEFDRLAFLPGEEMQVDYGEGALTRVPGNASCGASSAWPSDTPADWSTAPARVPSPTASTPTGTSRPPPRSS